MGFDRKQQPPLVARTGKRLPPATRRVQVPLQIVRRMLVRVLKRNPQKSNHHVRRVVRKQPKRHQKNVLPRRSLHKQLGQQRLPKVFFRRKQRLLNAKILKMQTLPPQLLQVPTGNPHPVELSTQPPLNTKSPTEYIYRNSVGLFAISLQFGTVISRFRT